MKGEQLLTRSEIGLIIEALRETAHRRDDSLESSPRWIPMENLATRLTTYLHEHDEGQEQTFALTVSDAVRVQSWYYAAGGDFIPDDYDRELARHLGNFVHGEENEA